MRAGALRHRIVVQRAVSSQDAAGAEVQAWQTFATVNASVEPISGKEYFAAQQVQSQVTHRIRIRHLSGVTTVDRVLFSGRIFNIVEVLNPGERGIETQLMAFEGSGA